MVDVLSRPYENLDQEVKNACLKYEQAQERKGLRIQKIVVTYTPKQPPYFNIEIEEALPAARNRRTTPKVAVKTSGCSHGDARCNGLGQIECLFCEQTLSPCTKPKCSECGGKA